MGSDTDWQSVSAGYDYAFAIKNDGTLWFAGYNGYGALGNGHHDYSAHPQFVQVGTDTWRAVSAGEYHTLAIKTDGTLWAWGDNEDGELGQGDTTDRYQPTQIATDTDWQTVSAGAYHSLAIKRNGTLWGWGNNSSGQLGLGDENDQHEPLQIGSATNWSAISAGSDYNYSSMGLKSDGTLWGWGQNNSGALGVGDTNQYDSPVQIGGDTDWAFAALGASHSAALKANGALYSSGSNNSGELGQGSTDGNSHPNPVQVGDPIWKLPTLASPAIISGLKINVGAGKKAAWGTLTWHSQALPEGGSIKFRVRTSDNGSTWGDWSDYFTEDEAGSSSGSADLSSVTQSRYLEFEVTLTSTDESPTLTDFSLGYTLSSSSTQGDSITWTSNSDFNNNAVVGPDLEFLTEDDGEATGAYTASTSVTIAQNKVTLAGGEFKTISAGYDYSAAIKSDGTLWAWGYNGYGQLGLGDTDDRSSPTQVGSDSDWVEVGTSNNDSFTFALKSDGTLWGWGYNGGGELGLGDTDTHIVPTQIGSDTNWKHISVGDYDTFAIKADGTLWSWGYNDNGKLGLGDTDFRNVPTQVGVDTNWQSVSAGYDDTLAIKTDGTLWGTGYNGYGELGLGDTDSRTEFEQIGSDTDWQHVFEGYGYTLAIKTDGTLWGTGYNGYGNLGNGTTNDEQGSFVQIGLDTDWSTVSANSDYDSSGIKTDGTLWAWGSNGYGELGVGDTNEHDSPVQVGTDTDWQSMSIGYYHGLAQKADGSLYSFGDNSYGELGLGYLDNLSQSLSPLSIAEDSLWKHIYAGNGYSLALKSDGTLWAWGYNGEGELGVGDTNNRDVPTEVGNETDWESIATTNSHVLAIKSDGTLWAWGNNTYDQLGLGDTDNRDTPTQVGIDTDWKSIAAGGAHSVAIKTDGTLWAWGSNYGGELGLGDTDNRDTPTQVGTDTDWDVITAGYFTLALKTDGTLWSWGYNYDNELGLGDTDNRDTPTQVGTDTDWSAISAGDYSSFALKSDNSLWVWGYNGEGELGIGDTNNRDIPARVGSDTDWSSLVAGTYDSFALKENGTLYGWGANGYGGLGLGDTVQHDTPTQVGSDTDWSSVAAGQTILGGHTLALKEDGRLFAWGDNEYGELGVTSLLVPNKVSSGWRLPVPYTSSGSVSGLKLNAGTGNTVNWTTLSWSSSVLPANTSIAFRVRTSSDNVTYSSWSSYFTEDEEGSTVGAADLSGITPSQYLEIETSLNSDTHHTPTLLDFTLSNTPVEEIMHNPGHEHHTHSSSRISIAPLIVPCRLGETFSTQTGLRCTTYTLPPLSPAQTPPTLTPPVTTVSTFASTGKILGLGSTGEEVRQLQKYLNTHGFPVALSGPGSLDHESTYFGPKTKAALIKFQEAHAAEILVPAGFKRGTGMLGPLTRRYISTHP